MKHPVRRILSLLLGVCLLLVPVLSLAACGEEETVRQNSITSVVLNAGEKNGPTVTVYAALTDDFLKSSKGPVYLYELTSQAGTSADLEQLDPVGEVKANRSLRFRIPLYDGVRTRLFSSFVLAAKDGDGRMTALCAPAAIPNADALAGGDAAGEAVEYSVKGLIADYPADAIRTGIAHTLIEVPMDKLILSGWTPDAVSYVWNGVSAFVDGQVLGELDEKIRLYTSAGVKVWLQFVLTGEGDAPLCLYVGGRPCAGGVVNMADPTAATIMEGFFDFMAARYAPNDAAVGHGLCNTFIIGRGVNGTAAAVCPGDGTLTAFVTNYEKLIRLADTALRAHNADGRVYISLNSDRTGTTLGGWGLQPFLSAFAQEVALRGAYDWQVACELYAASPVIWEPDGALDSDRLTVNSLSALTDLLSAERYLDSSGNARRPVITRFDIPSVGDGGRLDEANQAASYAFAYSTVAANGQIDALIYGTYADKAEGRGAGLCVLSPAGGEAVTVSRRTLYDVFRLIDTSAAQSVSDAVSTIIGEPYRRLEASMTGVSRPVRYVSGSASAETLKNKGTMLFDFGQGDACGFSDAGNRTYSALTASETVGHPILYTRFDRALIGDPMGVSTDVDAVGLIGGKELRIGLYAGPVGVSSTGTEITLRLVRASKGEIAGGDGTVIYESTVRDMQGGSWQTAVFDISSFTSLLDADDTVGLSVWVNGNDGTAYCLGMESVTVTGVTAHSTASVVIIVVAVVAILLIAGAVVFLALRKKLHP